MPRTTRRARARCRTASAAAPGRPRRASRSPGCPRGSRHPAARAAAASPQTSRAGSTSAVPVGLVQAAEVRRRVDDRARLRRRPAARSCSPSRAARAVQLAQVLELPRLDGDGQLAGAPEAAVDPVPRRRSPRSRRGSPRPSAAAPASPPASAPCPFAEPVREARRAEAAVAPGRRPAEPRALEQDDATPGVCLGGQQRRPQPGQAAADDGEVDREVAGERRPGLRPVRCVQPERDVPGVGQRRPGQA